MARPTTVLIILDGWGLGASNESNPIYVVNPPNFKWLGENYPLTSLQASGIGVGLPWGEVGNSEVGHLTIGAGKVVYQYFPKISMAIEDKSFFGNAVLKAAARHAREHQGALQFAGLLTKANVHASVKHLEALVNFAEQEQVPCSLHLFADGKDSPPHTVLEILKLVPREKVTTMVGRHYAMNRSENWSLTERAYRVMTGAEREQRAATPEEVVEQTYAKGLSEEFLPPTRFRDEGFVKDGDALVFFNFREDSMQQLAQAFALPGFDKFPVQPFANLSVVTFTRYSERLPCPVAFPADEVEKPLGQVLAEAGKTQLRIAETYKHAHVTFFFNGHREQPYAEEYRVMIPSLNSVHPDEHPELMAKAITDRLLEAIQNQSFDFILVNYSNPDTIAHTGNYDACLEAVKIVDQEIGRVLKVALLANATVVITADHGNMEEVLSPVTGRIETQHDTNPVPLYLVAPQFKNRKFFNWDSLRNETTGILADVAPTVLELMGIPKPKEMSGRSLLQDLIP